MSATAARERLRAIGRRRRRHVEAGEKLADDTRQEIRAIAGRGRLPVTEAAQLAGIHRSTAHEYLKASD